MHQERFLVTGVLGCIGAWTARALIREGAQVVGYDLGSGRHRLELVLTPEELDRVELVAGDVTDLEQLEQTIDEHEITNVIHLAALQVPASRANPPLAAAVNVVGTVNVFEAVKRRSDRIARVVYASSAAVYGAGDSGAEDARTLPETHYGVYKAANEGTARIYWQDDAVPSVGVRPYVVYGPGRDTGMTSAPTLAMLAAAQGEPYEIPFGGFVQLQHARDVAETLVLASRAHVEGAPVVNLDGGSTHITDVVAAIQAVVPDARIACRDVALPFPERLESGAVERILGAVPRTPLGDGVRETIEHFRSRPSLRPDPAGT